MKKSLLAVSLVLGFGLVACDRNAREEAQDLREDATELRQEAAETRQEAQQTETEAALAEKEANLEQRKEVVEERRENLGDNEAQVSPTGMRQTMTKEECEQLRIGGIEASERAAFDRCRAEGLVTGEQ